MIYPSAADCLRIVETALEERIKPLLTTSAGRSAAATIEHLLRLAAVRIEREGDVLVADIAALRGLLPALRDYVGAEDPALARRIDDALTRAYRAADAYPSLARLAEEAGALRQVLVDAQSWLIGRSAADRARDGYADMRARIKHYVAAQIAGEATLIEGSFVGRGPRR